jgi:CubicO group peptidase (beta-lactamase class C family)
MWKRRDVLAAAIALMAVAPARAQTAAAQTRFRAALNYSRDRGGAGLLVLRHGVILCEEPTPQAARGEPIPLGEASRIFVPLLAAELAADRLLSLDERVAGSTPGWGSDPLRQSITVRQLLNMTSGIALNQQPGEAPNASQALAASPLAPPGTRFQDDPAPLQIFADIARRKLIASGRPGDIGAYLQAEVLEPIGVSAGFSRDQDGTTILSTGASASLRTMGAIGELVRRGGLYRGRQIVSSTPLRDARLGSAVQPRFGLCLWLGGPLREPNGVGLDLAAANGSVPSDVCGVGGADGARLYVIPSAAAVIVRFAAAHQAARWSDAAFLQAALAAI